MGSVVGLVVCGGKSTRMGRDKSLIEYHGVPQWQFVYNLLKTHCSRTVISCNASQSKQFQKGISLLVDDEKFSEIGPMGAVLTAFRAYPSTPLLVIGCDYPLVASDDLSNLLKTRQEGVDAVCLYHEVGQVEEPMVALYEPTMHPILLTCFRNSDFSLRKALIKSNSLRIPPCSPNSLATADTPEQMAQLMEMLKTV
jgi:molybdopterin-guanine dinucleotide biosynthesis protein A